MTATIIIQLATVALAPLALLTIGAMALAR